MLVRLVKALGKPYLETGQGLGLGSGFLLPAASLNCTLDVLLPDGNFEDRTMKWPIVFALLTGLFWGTYGTAVGNSRAAEKNPFKPYVMIGVAYLIWGIVGGLVGMQATKAGFHFTSGGITWGLIGGSLGAFGALTLTLAMFSGGGAMPQIVMPCVFGTAVVVNALVNLVLVKSDHGVSPMLWVGVLGTAVSIVIVAYNTPHATPPKKPAPAPEVSVVEEG